MAAPGPKRRTPDSSRINRIGTLMVLMIDNYDSFTFNLVQYLGELGAEVRVFRNDEITVEAVDGAAPRRRSSSRRGRARRTRRAFRSSRSGASPVASRSSACASATRRSDRRSAARSCARSSVMHGKTVAHPARRHGVFSGIDERLSPRPATTRSSSSAHRCRPASRSAPSPRTARSWACATARCRWKACSSIPEALLTEHGHKMLQNFIAGSKGHEADHHRRGDPAHRRAPRGVPRRDAARHAPDHARRAHARRRSPASSSACA